MSTAQQYFPEMPRSKLLAIVASLPHAYGMPHSRMHYVTEGFTDDFGSIVLPCSMAHGAYASRYYFFRESA